MAHVLQLASRQGSDLFYVPLVNGKGSQSRTVGRGLTVESCVRHGWLTPKTYALTDAGRAAYAAYEARQARQARWRERHGW